jgi:hypothetical protein
MCMQNLRTEQTAKEINPSFLSHTVSRKKIEHKN